MFCGNCGEALTNEMAYCPKCGMKVVATNTMNQAENKTKEKAKIVSEEDMMGLLDTCYNKAINGIPHISPTIEEFAEDYLKKNPDREKAARAMVKNQIAKCATSGFITGFGGAITMPVTIPANLGSVLYVQMRMVACIAYLAGYELRSDQVQTFVYAALAGVSVNALVKQAGIKVGGKIAQKTIEKIPGKTLAKINQKVGFRLVTKFGEKGIVNLGKLIPGVGAVIGGTLDFTETKVIAGRAMKMFFKGELQETENDDNDIAEADILELDAEEILSEIRAISEEEKQIPLDNSAN